MLPSLRREVPGPELHQLPHPDAGVGQGADDELVPLGLRRVLHRLDLLPRQHLQHRFGQPGQLCLRLDRPAFPLGPGEEMVDGPDVGMDGVPGKRPPRTSEVHELTREPVQRPAGQPGRVGDALLLAERQQHLPKGIPVAVLQGVGREAPGLARREVVIHQDGQGSSGARHDGQLGHPTPPQPSAAQRVAGKSAR